MLGLLVVSVVGSLFARRVEFEFDVESLYAVNDEMLQYAHRFRDDFRNDDKLLLVVLDSVGEKDALDREALTWQIETVERLSRLPHVARVASVATWELPSLRLRPPFYATVSVVRGLPVTDDDEQRLRRLVDEYGMIDRSLISQDRRTAVLILALDATRREVAATAEVVRHMEQCLAESPPPPGFRVHLTGLPAVRARIISDLQSDQLHQIPMLGILFTVLLLLLFRDPAEALLPLVAVGMSVVWTVGLMGMAGWTFNLISNALPVLLLVIGVSNCVHIVCRFREELPRHEGSVRAAVVSTLTEMMVACLLTCLTTAIGFLSLCAGGSRVLREFGLEAAAGMLLLYVAAILCLGAGLTMFRRVRSGERTVHARPAQSNILAELATRLGMIGARFPWATLAATGLVITLCLVGARSVMVNSFLLETYDRDHPIRTGIRVVENQLFGFTTLEVSLSATSDQALFDPEVYRNVAEFARFAAGCEHVIMVRSYVDLLETAYRSFRSFEHHRGELPPTDAEGAARIELSRRLASRMGGHLGMDSFLRPDERRARIICAVEDAGTRATLKLIGTLQDRLDQLFPAGHAVEARLTGEAYLFAHSLDALIRNIFFSLCMASVLIFLIIGLLFRSIRAGLTAMIPNVLPLLVTLSYMGVRGLDLDAGNVVVFAVSIGIAVDNTIHFLARLYEERRHHTPMLTAMERTLRGSGRAVVLTTTIILAGLSVMFTSEFLPTRRFAELTTVTMLAALVGDLIVLPACVAIESRYSRQPSPQTGSCEKPDCAVRPG